MRSHTQTGSSALARRFKIRTLCGSPRALKTDARVAASSGVMPGAATGLQHATGAIGISCDKVAISHSSFVFHRPSSTNFDLAYRLSTDVDAGSPREGAPVGGGRPRGRGRLSALARRG